MWITHFFELSNLYISFYISFISFKEAWENSRKPLFMRVLRGRKKSNCNIFRVYCNIFRVYCNIFRVIESSLKLMYYA